MKIYDDEELWSVEYKKDASPLTLADKVSNDIIVSELKSKFDKYAILSEEEKDTKERLGNDYCFVVDPLDGTKEFIKKNGQFTVNIALAYKQRPVVGVIYVPALDELYYASKGSGAYKISKVSENSEPEQILVSKDESRLKCVVSGSHGCEEMDKLIEQKGIKDFVSMGSSLKGCLVASGEADIYYRFNPTMEWDTAAMQCIVEEAGGIFRQMDGSEMLYNREDCLNSKGFYAVNVEENVFV